MINLSEEEQENKEEKEGKEENGKKKKGKLPFPAGKDTYLILILAGILLFIIAMPTKSSSDRKAETGTGKQESGMDILEQTEKKPTTDAEAEAVSAGVGKTRGDGTEDYTAWLEGKLEELLSCMAGVGKVRTMVTVSASEEEIVEKDTNSNRSISGEADSAGGNRNGNEMSNQETTVYLTDGEGNKVPYVVKKMEPDVKGVTVVAQGGGNASVCQSITEVIQALFGIEAHKIKVVPMKE